MRFSTERLILKSLELSFADDFVEGLNNLNVSKNLETVPHPYAKKDAINWIKKNIKEKKKTKFLFGIYLKSEKKIIGVVDFSINKDNLVARSGSWINEKYWRQGFVTEAKIVVIDYLFKNHKIRKFFTQVYSGNIASRKAIMKLGYKKEGLLRKNSISKATGKIHDVIALGLLKEEWEERRKSLISKFK
ncbi:MAG: GNAT family protein [Candidatus ainarchaeum sp.]|nr:GNAT family protein [Candidatus ainarchaeum sp.]MDD4221389.1 GNAT family protein [Candidatus ainarchaeum sp.]MDD4662371.1 GNAT family protein [Candidatus ainarchaeum sp.]